MVDPSSRAPPCAPSLGDSLLAAASEMDKFLRTSSLARCLSASLGSLRRRTSERAVSLESDEGWRMGGAAQEGEETWVVVWGVNVDESSTRTLTCRTPGGDGRVRSPVVRT
jgi:hypothetical protein